MLLKIDSSIGRLKDFFLMGNRFMVISLVFTLALTPLFSETNKKEYKITFIEIGATNCIMCKKMLKVMEELKKDYKEDVNFVFHNVWTPEGKPAIKKFKIRLIPTQVFLDEKGKEFFRHEGFFSKEKILELFRARGVK